MTERAAARCRDSAIAGIASKSPRNRALRRLAWTLALLLGAAAAWLGFDWQRALPPGIVPYYVGRQSCGECHAEYVERWLGSDHERAMDRARPAVMLGDFADRKFTHFGAVSTLFRRDGKYFARTDGPDGKLRDFEILYAFGVRPLQQYLVAFPDGRVQCLPMAWDTQDKRWFHLYANEPIPHTDELHWTRPLQNWNYMCADCHSTNLQRNYDLATNAYHTDFSEINVSCEACHGPASLHVQLAGQRKVFWDRRYGYGLPRLKADDARVQIESCAPCHARRRNVFPGFQPGDKFLDFYVPELLDSELYYADGQIRDEDYEYGSFIQSKMYHKNVRCSDCHDPHTQRVKFKTGPTIVDNRLCGQCHVPAKYDTPNHHHHPDASKAGWLCIDCHMPKTKYMVVDPRLDHSIRIPRPDLTVALGIPNACNGCHSDAAKKETPEWAVDKCREWWGPLKGPPHFAHALAAGRQNKPEGESLLDAVVRRKDLSAMVRASALILLGRYRGAIVQADAQEALRDPEPLVRVGAVRCLESLPLEQIRQDLLPMLRDPLRAVRMEAIRALNALPIDRLSAADRQAFEKALAEYVASQQALADQPAAHLNLAVLYAGQQRLPEALAEYEAALRIDPRFIPARVNLAMLYDQLGRKADAEAQFRAVLAQEPKMGPAHYSLALLLAEDERRMAEAVEHLTKAAELTPDNGRVHYNRGLALQKLGRLDEAVTALKRASVVAGDDPTDAIYALALLHAQRKQWAEAIACAEHLAQRHPRAAEFQQLLARFRKQSASAPSK